MGLWAHGAEEAATASVYAGGVLRVRVEDVVVGSVCAAVVGAAIGYPCVTGPCKEGPVVQVCVHIAVSGAG